MARERTFSSGILGFPVTPFHENSTIDEKAFAYNVEFLVKEGLSAMFVGCGSGEFQSLSVSEYQALLEAAVSVCAGKVPVYAGVGGNIKNAVELAEVAEKAGADGYLLLPPYLVDSEQAGLYEYVKTIVDSTDLNAVVYQRNNAIFTVDTVQRLAQLPKIVGFKDGYGNMELMVEITKTVGDRLEWCNGMPFAEVTMPAYYALGFKSYSSAISNYIPHISRLFFAAVRNGETALVSDLYREVILPINRIRKQRKGYAVSLIKAGMEIMGMPVGGAVRAPLMPVEKEHYQQLEAVLARALDRFPKPAQG
ncbi:5-dehydro-4-deoxyglucarate dehydratase [Alicyclobacillus tolerans]|uniref:5-dehydro-4-deoxyglucarate dehydratase n=1 Tax=Alicyclobacillus tolerans TaxID=90970 RepID=UPI001F02BB46|nr:5-dehydro-4-deoxyglucarate dehydratase [Alicyclobacillus tolerans]MCF8564124.1 5-dehydro-4-deoxyglucarate dehydratase [Alicyclobacillus tolerans]